MSLIPLLIVVGFVILVMYFLLNKKSTEQDREGVVKDVLSKDALSVDFGEGRATVVKFFGITLASESEMLDEKIFGFFEDNLRGRRVKARARLGDAQNLIAAEVYTMGGEYVNAVLVRHGLARWSPSEAANDSALAEAQELAKSEKLGVWNPAVRQLVEERLKHESTESLSDDDIANRSIDPEKDEEK